VNSILADVPVREQLEEALAVHRLAVALAVELHRLNILTATWEDLPMTHQARLRERVTIALRLDHPEHSIRARVRARVKLAEARETCEQPSIYTGILTPGKYQADVCVTAFLDGLTEKFPVEPEDR
jgi:hypothetical protein